MRLCRCPRGAHGKRGWRRSGGDRTDLLWQEGNVVAAGTIIGTPHNDVIVGSAGDDVIEGLGGNDRICSLDGTDRPTGGPGNDRIDGGAGQDFIAGDVKDAGDVSADGGNDLLLGGDGDDRLVGDNSWGLSRDTAVSR